mgnify:CR=1 FL=1
MPTAAHVHGYGYGYGYGYGMFQNAAVKFEASSVVQLLIQMDKYLELSMPRHGDLAISLIDKCLRF